MPKSELLEKIREDYLAAHPDAAVSAIDDFCEHFVSWLAATGVVGVGHTPNGLALRFADGRELGLLFLESDLGVADTPSVAIATKASGARQGISGESPSVRITAR